MSSGFWPYRVKSFGHAPERKVAARQIDKRARRRLFLEFADQVDILLLDECQLDFTELWAVPVELFKILAHLANFEFPAAPRVDLVAGRPELSFWLSGATSSLVKSRRSELTKKNPADGAETSSSILPDQLDIVSLDCVQLRSRMVVGLYQSNSSRKCSVHGGGSLNLPPLRAKISLRASRRSAASSSFNRSGLSKNGAGIGNTDTLGRHRVRRRERCDPAGRTRSPAQAEWARRVSEPSVHTV